MKGRAFIKDLRAGFVVVTYEPDGTSNEGDIFCLLADAVEEADGSFRDLIESECVFVESEGAVVEGDGWWDTSLAVDGAGGSFLLSGGYLSKPLSYLERRGLIERKPGEPHLVRFVEEA